MMRYPFLFFLFFSLCGCTTDEPVLTFAVGGAPTEIDYWQELLKDFENKTKLKVRIIRQPTDTDLRRQNLVVALNAGKGDPDVFLMDVVWIAQFAASEWLLPLNPYMAMGDLSTSDFFESILNQVDVYEGNIAALPVYIDCGLLYYRKDLIDKYRCPVPETWEELLNCAALVQEAERKSNPRFYGFVWQGAQYEGLICNFLEYAYSNKGDFSPLYSENNIEALEFMRDLIHGYRLSPPNTFTEMKEEEVRAFFESGDSLFERNWPYAWKLHQREGSRVKGKVGIAMLPKFKEGRHPSTLGGWHIGISRFSDKKEEAWRLVEFILSYGTQKGLALDLGWNPGRKDIYDDLEVIERLPHMETIKRACGQAVARPNLPYYTLVSQILQGSINSAITGKEEPERALARAQKGIMKVYEVYSE